MATISSPGLGSGLDVTSIVTKLVAIERQPIEALQTKAKSIESELSAFGLLQSYSGNLRDIADKLAQASFWTGNTATSSDSSMTVTAAATATGGSYTVEVSQLAAAQNLASKGYTDSNSVIGGGTLRVQLGSWNNDSTVFTANAEKLPVDIVIDAGSTMDTVKDKINAANAGVTASIVRDASGAKLVVRSLTTGVANAVQITATDDDGNNTDANGLSALAYDPPSGTGRMTQTLAAKNTLATVNGLAVTSSTTKFDNVIDGVTLTVGKVTTSPSTVNVAMDTATLKKAVSDFAKTYSDMASYIATQTKYDATTKKAGALQGDRSTLTIQNTLKSMILGTSAASSTFARLNDIGVEMQKDGTLKVNDAKLSAALASKPAEVAKLFSNNPPGYSEGQGFAVRAKALATAMTSSDGSITTHTKSLRDAITRNATDQQKLEERVAITQARLNKQYTNLDTLMSSISGQNSSLTQSLAALANLSKSIASGNS